MDAVDDSDEESGSTEEYWCLRLYVAGQSPRSLAAISNLKALCEEHLNGRYEIETVDLAEQPGKANDDGILAIPTLVLRLPKPLRKIIGDLSDTGRVLVRLRAPDRASAPMGPSAGQEVHYGLTLFVSGASDLSARAIANATKLCDTHLAGRYDLSVVDIHEDAAAVLKSGVLATPTLVKNEPLPVKKLVGDLSQTDKVLLALGLPVSEGNPRAMR